MDQKPYRITIKINADVNEIDAMEYVLMLIKDDAPRGFIVFDDGICVYSTRNSRTNNRIFHVSKSGLLNQMYESHGVK